MLQGSLFIRQPLSMSLSNVQWTSPKLSLAARKKNSATTSCGGRDKYQLCRPTACHIIKRSNFPIFPKVSVPALLAPATLSIGQAQPVCHIAQVMMMMMVMMIKTKQTKVMVINYQLSESDDDDDDVTNKSESERREMIANSGWRAHQLPMCLSNRPRGLPFQCKILKSLSVFGQTPTFSDFSLSYSVNRI